MKREREFLKNSIVLSFGTIVPKLTQIITLPIVTGCLTTEEYGTYDLITVLVSLLLPVATLQMQTAAFRFLIQVRDSREEQKKIITNIFAFTLPVSITVLIVLFFCMWSVSWKIRLLIIFYYLMDIMLATVKQIARGLGMNLAYSVGSIINSVGEMLLILLLLGGLKEGLSGAVLALGISQAVAFLFVLVRTKTLNYISFKTVSRREIRRLLAYAWPMVPNSLSSWVMRLSDRLVLSAVLGVEANAIYAVANKLPNIYSVVQSTFTLAWQENASMSVNDENSGEYYGKMFDSIFNFLVGLMALLIAFTPVIFRLLIRGDYDAAYNHMPILYIAALFSSVSAYLGGIYIAKMKTKEIGITTTLAAAANFLIDLIFVKMLGIYAASLSTLISYFALAVYRMFDIQKIQKIHFRVKKIIIFVVLLSLMSFLCFQRKTTMDIVNISVALVTAVLLNRQMFHGAIIMMRQRLKR